MKRDVLSLLAFVAAMLQMRQYLRRGELGDAFLNMGTKAAAPNTDLFLYLL